MPPEQLVRVIHALVEGLVLLRLLTPDPFSDQVVHAAFGALSASRRESPVGRDRTPENDARVGSSSE